MTTFRLCARRLVLFVAVSLVVTTVAYGETAQQENLRVAFSGQFSPHSLPRDGRAPVGISIDGRISTVDGSDPPQLRRMDVEVNRHAHLNLDLPSCHFAQIQPSTSRDAMAACRPSFVGEGTFTADVRLPRQAPFPSRGKVLAFFGHEGGRPVLFAHVYGTDPIPTSYTLPFAIEKSHGAYGSELSAFLPRVTADWGFVTGIELRLRRGFFSAGCPAPKGFPGAIFPLVRASFGFGDKRSLGVVLERNCHVRADRKG